MAPQPTSNPLATVAQRGAQPGVIPISAVNSGPRGRGSNAGAREPAQRLKVVVRRLPPGLTEHEFFAALGEEWKIGNKKVTWVNYRPGKISKDYLNALAQVVPKTTFTDTKSTQHDPALIGPPALEYALYSRTPSHRKPDNRRGTIDQDPEFIDFLQSLTAPIQKPKALDANDIAKEELVAVTPLIQHLRDKKAAKEKAAAAKTAKQDKQHDDGKPENKRPGAAKDATPAKDTKAASPAKTSTKPTKDVRSPSRNDLKAAAAAAASRAPAAAPTKPTTAQAPASPNRRRETTSPGTAAARMLQRDLPFAGRGGRAAVVAAATRGGRGGRSPEVRKATVNTAPAHATSASTSTSTAPTPQILPPAPSTPDSNPQPKPTTSSPRAPKQPTKSTPTDPAATRAFLKHANASQGITEPPLNAALRQFGDITALTIDKRKGFAYVDFAEPTGLQAAMAASPVPVAQGSVQVLERKDRVEQGGASASTKTPAAGSASVGAGTGARGRGQGFRGRGASRGGGRGGGGGGGGGRGGSAGASATGSGGTTAKGATPSSAGETG